MRLRLDGFLALGDEDFRWALEMNFFTTLRMTRAALVPMVDQGRGAIVNIASVNAFFQPDGATVDYGAAKAAGPQPHEIARAGVRAVGHPHQRDLPRTGRDRPVARRARRRRDRRSDDRRRRRHRPGPRRRGNRRICDRPFTRPEEVAALAVMLASDQLGNVTGENVVIDGGLIRTT